MNRFPMMMIGLWTLLAGDPAMAEVNGVTLPGSKVEKLSGEFQFTEGANGITGTPDGKRLYVSDLGTQRTYAYEIHIDGSLANKRLFCEMGSDGMTIDSEGNVYLTGKGVTVFDKSGKQIDHIDVPEHWSANVCFGGKDRKTLFITASKGLYAVKMRVKGVDEKGGK